MNRIFHAHFTGISKLFIDRLMYNVEVLIDVRDKATSNLRDIKFSYVSQY